tara:strand:+ start:17681 stop:18277 length:597 start_codon:yes stop_codon:yes gene_type:complete
VELWGVGLLKGYFVQYKFIIPEATKHSSYTYQKLFRALYGYTQNVTKANGKTYHYHRKGILSEIPYIRPGKNCVIIPPKSFSSLDSFFKTGKNPSHYWRVKGDWKAVFYLDEKNLDEKQVVTALKDQIKRGFQGDDQAVLDLTFLADKVKNNEPISKDKINLALNEAEPIISNPWFKEVYQKDPGLKQFFDAYRALKP